MMSEVQRLTSEVLAGKNSHLDPVDVDCTGPDAKFAGFSLFEACPHGHASDTGGGKQADRRLHTEMPKSLEPRSTDEFSVCKKHDPFVGQQGDDGLDQLDAALHVTAPTLWEHRPRQGETEGAPQDADDEQVDRICSPGPVGAIHH